MTENLIVFGQDYPILVLVFGVALTVGLIVREWVRENTRRRGLRCFTALILGLTVLAIIYQPAIKTSLERSKLILVTPGYDQGQLDSLKGVMSRAELIRADSIDHTYPDLDKYGSVVVLGEGIPQFDLWKFKDRPVQFIPTSDLSGLTRVNFPRAFNQEQKLTIKGEFLTDQDSMVLFLEGAEGKLDSTVVRANQSQFELSFVPKTVGNFIYTLKNGSGTLAESLPMTIEPSKKLKVMMINAFPTFEMRYLKNSKTKQIHL